MALATFTDLKASIADYLARADLTSVIPDFITLAEARINRNIRHRSMETETTLSTVAGTATVSLPTDFLEVRAIQISDTANYPLTALTSEQFNAAFSANPSGRPTNYVITGGNFKFGPEPDAVYSVDLVYYARVPALTVGAPTNWLLTNHPDVYLYGALMEAQPYLRNDERIQIWMGLYDRAMADLKGEDARAKWAGARLTPSIDVMNGGRFNINWG